MKNLIQWYRNFFKVPDTVSDGRVAIHIGVYMLVIVILVILIARYVVSLSLA